jgi:hypothetical protein
MYERSIDRTAGEDIATGMESDESGGFSLIQSHVVFLDNEQGETFAQSLDGIDDELVAKSKAFLARSI